MKRIPLLLIIAGLVGFVACKNQPVDFSNFKYNAVYFPLQAPERVLSLGPGRVPNPLDQKLEFHIGIDIGGMYQNNKNWWVTFKEDTSLIDNLVNGNGEKLKVLPSKYFTMTPSQKVVIPADSMDGLILVQLNNSFLDDSLAWSGNHYVIPLLITGTDADSVLSGKPVVSNPARTNPSDWNTGEAPKDYTLFGIKYINKYDGSYLHRGVDLTYDQSGSIVNISAYHAQNTVDDKVWDLATKGKNTVETDGIAENSGNGYTMRLTFTDNGTVNKPADGPVTVSSVPGAKFAVSGSGTYKTDGGSWGGEKYDAIYLKYHYADGSYTHQVTDTLVFRNRNITFEQMNLTYTN